ncbi:MAG: DnaJ domain-containing protein [Planctomycetota bacterium]
MHWQSRPQYWYARFLAGITMIVLAGAFGIGKPFSLLVGLSGFWLAIGAVTPVIRLLTREVHAHREWSNEATAAFARASLPRRIYYLLAAVAEADGPITRVERETVRHFVLERFADPIHGGEVEQWETQPLHVRDAAGLAARIAAGLDEGELDTLFSWCCLVAFADGKFAAEEHAVLQQVSRGLGLPSMRARMLFHMARALFLRGDTRGQATRPRAGVDERAQAFAVLGLPVGATADQIKKRHRELAKRFHPDAQPNLGPVAQREATERFQAIQRAYEVLSAT